MNQISFTCSNSHPFKVPAKFAGKRAKCPKCGEVATIPQVSTLNTTSKIIPSNDDLEKSRSTGELSPLAASVPNNRIQFPVTYTETHCAQSSNEQPSTDQMTDFKCTCGHKRSVPESALGKSERCPKCLRVVKIKKQVKDIDSSPEREPLLYKFAVFIPGLLFIFAVWFVQNKIFGLNLPMISILRNVLLFMLLLGFIVIPILNFIINFLVLRPQARWPVFACVSLLIFCFAAYSIYDRIETYGELTELHRRKDAVEKRIEKNSEILTELIGPKTIELKLRR